MPGPRSPRVASHSLVPLTIALGAALLSGPASGEDAMDDGVASGTVAFFDSQTGACPAGWTPAEDTAGRLIVSVVDASAVGQLVGVPLADQEDRTHAHTFSTTVDLPYKSIAAADGSNNQGAAAGELPVEGTTDPAPSGLPFIQLLVCEKR